jgi:hypothetical protein
MHPHKIMASLMLALVMSCSAGRTWAQGERTLPASPEVTGGEVYLDSSRFQARIRSASDLGTLAKQQVALGEQAVAFGFAARSAEARFFIIGSLYTEAVAHLHSGNVMEAAKQLAAIEQELVTLQAPGSLYNYLTKTRNILERQQYTDEVRTDFLALLQPFLDDYAKSQGDAKLTLFRAGTWLIDVGLAAAAQDTPALRQPIKAQYFNREMKRLAAPKGVLEAMDQITRITEKPEITDSDARVVLKLVKQIQELLG